jgi:hypothetical protein
MKLITGLLCVQLLAGFVGAYVAFAYIQTAAMGIDYGRRLRKEFEEVRKSAEYREPLEVKGYSHAELIDRYESDAHTRGEIALFAFCFSIGASVFAAMLLFLLYRVHRRLRTTSAE